MIEMHTCTYNVKYICDDLGLFGLHDGEELLCNDRQHLNVDAIELIKAAPSSGLSQPREETTHHLTFENNVRVSQNCVFRNHWFNLHVNEHITTHCGDTHLPW